MTGRMHGTTERGGTIDREAIAATAGAAVVLTTPPTATATAVLAPPSDVLQILTEEELETLVQGFNRNFLLGAAPRMIPYPKVKGWVDWIANTVFNPASPGVQGSGQTTLTALQRETVILSVVATQRDTHLLAGRIYWSLMEGLSVENVADVLTTVGTYNGINNLRLSMTVLVDTLLLFKESIAKGEATTEKILPKLRAAFAPR